MRNVLKCIFCAVLIAVSSLTAMAAEISYEPETGTFSYSLVPEKAAGYINIRIYPFGFDPMADDMGNVILKSASVNSSGEFDGRIILPESFDDGRYEAYITCGDSVWEKLFIKADSVRLAELTDRITTGGEVHGLLKENNSLFDSSEEIFETYGSQLAQYVKLNYDTETLLNARMQGEALSLVSTGKMKFGEAAERYSVYFDDALAEYYSLSDTEKETADKLMVNVIKSSEPLREQLESILFISRAAAADAEKLKYILLENTDVLGLDTDAYDSLSSYYQSRVFAVLTGKAAEWQNMDDIAADFVEAAEAQKKLMNKENSSSSSGGSGKGSYTPVSGSAVPEKTVFTDVDGHWAKDAIISLYDKSIISGYADNTFLPDSPITRAEFVVMAVRLLGAQYNQTMSFADVNTSDWFYQSVMTAAANGWVSGISDTEFAPNKLITREDAAVIMYRAAGASLGVAEGAADFSDAAEISPYAAEAVAAMYENGIISGYDGAFYPKKEITRAEAAQIFNVLINSDRLDVKLSSGRSLVSERQYYAEKLLGYLAALPEKSGKGITRTDFEKTVKDLFYVYGDETAWFADGADMSANISTAEAVRAVICATGYDYLAQGLYGGAYPDSYIKTASRYEFDEGVSISGLDAEIEWESAVVLLYNALNAHCVPAGELNEIENEKTWLETLYNIVTTNGVVNRTQVSSLNASDPVKNDNYIELGGERYFYETDAELLLGVRCRAFYKETDGERYAVLLIPIDTQEFIIDADSYEETESLKLKYEEDGRTKKLTLDSGVQLMYNNRAVGWNEEYFKNADGTVRLLDNDDDGEYELVFINDYTGATVESSEPWGISIGFGENTEYLEIDSDDILVRIIDEKGERLTPYDIKKGDVVELCTSADGLYIILRRCTKTVSGTVMYTDTEENTVSIDGTEYMLSKKLPDDELAMLGVGNNVKCYIGTSGRIIAVRTSSDEFAYGYLLKSGFVNDDDTAGIRLLDIGGKVVTLFAADKVDLDGVSLDAQEFKETAIDIEAKQIVRYSTDSDGALRKLDLAEECDSLQMFEYLPEDNSLLRYKFSTTSFTYRSSPKSCMPYFNVSDTVLFKVPKDISQIDFALVGDCSSMLLDNTSYNLTVYDLDEGGTPAVAVLEYESTTEKPNWKDFSYIVEKITDGISEDSEAVRIVNCWSNGKYYTLNLPYDVDAGKDNGEELSSGDIFRAKLKNDGYTIASMCVDIYLENGIPTANSSQDAVLGGGNVNIAYQLGRMYKISGNYAYMATEQDIFGEYIYSLSALKNVSIKTSHIVKYDVETGEVRPVTADSIKTYSSYGNECGFVALRQSRFDAVGMYVYE